MTTTVFLAQIIGFFFLVTGLSMIVRRKMMMEIFGDMIRHRALTYILGVVLLVFGYLIVANHNLWGGVGGIIITILGWALVLESVMYLFFSKQTLSKMFGFLSNKDFYYVMSVAYFVLGGYLFGTGIGLF